MCLSMSELEMSAGEWHLGTRGTMLTFGAGVPRADLSSRGRMGEDIKQADTSQTSTTTSATATGQELCSHRLEQVHADARTVKSGDVARQHQYTWSTRCLPNGSRCQP